MPPRNNQKYSYGSQGLFIAVPGKLHTIRTQQKAISMVKQIRITIETNSLLVLRGRNAGRRWCPQCAAESETVALGNAEALAKLQSPGLEEWLISGALHRFETAEGSELICLTSLQACARNPRVG